MFGVQTATSFVDVTFNTSKPRPMKKDYSWAARLLMMLSAPVVAIVVCVCVLSQTLTNQSIAILE